MPNHSLQDKVVGPAPGAVWGGGGGGAGGGAGGAGAGGGGGLAGRETHLTTRYQLCSHKAYP